MKHTLYVSYTMCLRQNTRINKGERTSQNKKTMHIFVTYELGIWYLYIYVCYKVRTETGIQKQGV
jgi:hypothetical protein